MIVADHEGVACWLYTGHDEVDFLDTVPPERVGYQGIPHRAIPEDVAAALVDVAEAAAWFSKQISAESRAGLNAALDRLDAARRNQGDPS